MKYFFFIIICIIANSCEKLIYGEYKILDYFQSDKKVNQNMYKVLDGDNLYSISKKKNVSLKKLIEINKISYPYKIFKNQIIFIPQKESHIVSKGETLYSISRKYNVDQYSLVKINNITKNNIIYIGQKLIIPYKNYKLEKIIKKKVKDKQNITVKKDLIKNKPNFIWPVKGEVILKFGRIRPGFHNDGINIKTYLNNDVVASESGLIIYTGNEIPGYGNLVLIKHNQNWITAYSHLDTINLSRGSNVKKGQKIGTVGISGNVNKPQLHFEIRKGKKAFNPENFLS